MSVRISVGGMHLPSPMGFKRCEIRWKGVGCASAFHEQRNVMVHPMPDPERTLFTAPLQRMLRRYLR